MPLGGQGPDRLGRLGGPGRRGCRDHAQNHQACDVLHLVCSPSPRRGCNGGAFKRRAVRPDLLQAYQPDAPFARAGNRPPAALQHRAVVLDQARGGGVPRRRPPRLGVERPRPARPAAAASPASAAIAAARAAGSSGGTSRAALRARAGRSRRVPPTSVATTGTPDGRRLQQHAAQRLLPGRMDQQRQLARAIRSTSSRERPASAAARPAVRSAAGVQLGLEPPRLVLVATTARRRSGSGRRGSSSARRRRRPDQHVLPLAQADLADRADQRRAGRQARARGAGSRSAGRGRNCSRSTPL